MDDDDGCRLRPAVSPGEIEMPEWFLWFDPPGGAVVQFYAHVWDDHGRVEGQRLCDPAAVGVDHHQAQRLQHTHTRGEDRTETRSMEGGGGSTEEEAAP